VRREKWKILARIGKRIICTEWDNFRDRDQYGDRNVDWNTVLTLLLWKVHFSGRLLWCLNFLIVII